MDWGDGVGGGVALILGILGVVKVGMLVAVLVAALSLGICVVFFYSCSDRTSLSSNFVLCSSFFFLVGFPLVGVVLRMLRVHAIYASWYRSVQASLSRRGVQTPVPPKPPVEPKPPTPRTVSSSSCTTTTSGV